MIDPDEWADASEDDEAEERAREAFQEILDGRPLMDQPGVEGDE